MAVEKPYADFAWYTDEYYGSDVPGESFAGMAMKASYLVDELTVGNLQRLDTLPDCVKDATCAAAEKMYQLQAAPGRELKSESNDGYSVTYADVSQETIMDEARATIRVYLSTSGLLFRGCRRRKC